MVPVDRCNHRVHCESAGVQVVLIPDALADGEAIVGSVDRVVYRNDKGEEPGENCEDLVDSHRRRAVVLPLAEGVVCACQYVVNLPKESIETYVCSSRSCWRCCSELKLDELLLEDYVRGWKGKQVEGGR